MAGRVGTSTRGIQLGFAAVVVSLLGASMGGLYVEQRTSARIDVLVERALERERLLGLLRLDAELLAQAADDHINARDAADRAEADRAMSVVLDEINTTSARYASLMPDSESPTWNKLTDISGQLVKTVAVTVKYSNRREEERAQRHLEEVVKPINFELDEVANTLAKQNTQQTRLVLRQQQDLRRGARLGSAITLAGALVLSLVVAWQVTRTLNRQQHTIREQVAELERRNEELDAFASRVAHDLVAPLAPLKGYLTLARRQSGDDQVRELLTQAEASTTRVSDLVEALLQFCRAGQPPDRGAPAELDTAVATVLLEASQAAAASNVELTRDMAARVTVACSSHLLSSIARNLVSNALKYSAGRAGATVRVRVAAEGAWGVLEVRDTGVGMAPETVKQLFQPFFRAPGAAGVPGYGLGLATTRRLVEAHGGSVEVESVEGQGSRFVARLPLAATAPVAGRALERVTS